MAMATCRRRRDAQQPHAARQASVRDFEARLGLASARPNGMALKPTENGDVTTKKIVTELGKMDENGDIIGISPAKLGR